MLMQGFGSRLEAPARMVQALASLSVSLVPPVLLPPARPCTKYLPVEVQLVGGNMQAQPDTTRYDTQLESSTIIGPNFNLDITLNYVCSHGRRFRIRPYIHISERRLGNRAINQSIALHPFFSVYAPMRSYS